MTILYDNETCEQARLVLRELIEGDKTSAQLWSTLVDKQLDDVDLRFILPPLANGGYIQECLGKWRILPKGVKHIEQYDRMMLESVEGYLDSSRKLVDKAKLDRKLELEMQREGNKWSKYGFIVALISVILGLVYFLYEKIA